MHSLPNPVSESDPQLDWNDILSRIELAVPGVVLVYCSQCSIPKVESADEVRQCETPDCGVVACGECKHEVFSSWSESDSNEVLCNGCLS